MDALSKSYSGVAVVNAINLRVPAGSIFGFLGPNGSGKSTTVKMISGALAPDQGDARILGRSICKEDVAVKKTVGVLMDGIALFEYLTIWEHLDLVRSLFDVDKIDFAHRSGQLLRMFDLVQDAGKLVREASYGMRKKTALSMALLPNPEVLILDEPFEGLDPVMTVGLKNALRVAAGRGKTVFLTTHMLGGVGDLLTDYAILRSGNIVAEGSRESLDRLGITLEEHYLTCFDDQQKEDLAWLS